MDTNSIWVLAACAFITSTIHMLSKIAKLNKMSDGDVNYNQFFKREWVYIAISFLTIILALIAHETISQLKTLGEKAGDWMPIVYMFVGWTSDSIVYNVFGKLETKVIKDIKEKTK